MITFAICLIYYGIALFLYQVHGWLTHGVWVAFPVRKFWEGFFGARLGPESLAALTDWFLSWPASLALFTVGFSTLGLVFLVRRGTELRRDRVRRKWILQQCAAMGYKPWAIPRVLRELDDRMQVEKAAQREELS